MRTHCCCACRFCVMYWGGASDPVHVVIPACDCCENLRFECTRGCSKAQKNLHDACTSQCRHFAPSNFCKALVVNSGVMAHRGQRVHSSDCHQVVQGRFAVASAVPFPQEIIPLGNADIDYQYIARVKAFNPEWLFEYFLGHSCILGHAGLSHPNGGGLWYAPEIWRSSRILDGTRLW